MKSKVQWKRDRLETSISIVRRWEISSRSFHFSWGDKMCIKFFNYRQLSLPEVTCLFRFEFHLTISRCNRSHHSDRQKHCWPLQLARLLTKVILMTSISPPAASALQHLQIINMNDRAYTYMIVRRPNRSTGDARRSIFINLHALFNAFEREVKLFSASIIS